MRHASRILRQCQGSSTGGDPCSLVELPGGHSKHDSKQQILLAFQELNSRSSTYSWPPGVEFQIQHLLGGVPVT
jgi:hypothetical protein